MSIKIRVSDATSVLEDAFAVATSDAELPGRWSQFSFEVFDMNAKTYTAALCTAMLAKACNDAVDALSIKVTEDPRSFSLRTLCHSVVVPVSARLGFTIRTTGREPLNNQPFFRYNHVAEIDRVRDLSAHNSYVVGLQLLQDLVAKDAFLALAAFVRVGVERAQHRRAGPVGISAVAFEDLFRITSDFLAPGVVDRPRRLQAAVAAGFDVSFDDVLTRKLNDPSRDFPGDVHVLDLDWPIIAVEVRGKPVPRSEAEIFFQACRQADIRRALIVVDAPSLNNINESAPNRPSDLLSGIYYGLNSLLLDIFMFASMRDSLAIEKFAHRLWVRLEEIEAAPAAFSEWNLLNS